MKYSKYNFLKEINGKFYILNIFTSSYIELSREEYFQILHNKSINDSLFLRLKNCGMILTDDVDEIKILKDRYYENQKKKDLLTITIAPTLRCNFCCSYCYENKNGKIIDEISQEKIINFIEKQLQLGYSKFNLIWFGGEPLMAYSIIRKMSYKIIEICKKYQVDYNSYMTTNGYLLTDNIIEELPLLKINQLYITLDGLAQIHNKRRFLLDGGSTYDVIVANLQKLKKKNINTVVRMNIDKTNFNKIEELRKFVSNQLQLPIYLGLVRQYTTSCLNENIYFNKEEYSQILDIFESNLEKDGMFNFTLPRQLPIYCRACKVGTFVIDPDLNIFKCENDIGRYEKRISTIDDYPFDCELTQIYNKSYYEWNPFNYPTCLECNILPICTGGCPYIGIKNNTPECEIYKYDIDKRIKKYILKIDSNSGH